jgi:alkyl hydroperoxide reductase subunit D
MAMNNIYYRFVHLVHAADYKTLPAKLRMTAMAKPGVDKVDFELWSLVVSARQRLRHVPGEPREGAARHGLSAEQVQAGVRIAATVHRRCPDAGGRGGIDAGPGAGGLVPLAAVGKGA